jgi:sugar (pentulose or hexulose) kinase
VEQAPELWWQAVVSVLRALTRSLHGHRPEALSLDGTSSTLLLCRADGTPLGPALMYSDTRCREEARHIDALAATASPARGASSSLSKLLYLRQRLRPPSGTLALHQADWILGRLTGRFGVSDWNNCLKLGFDPRRECWPDWMRGLDLDPVELPRVVAPGTPCGRLDREAALATGLPETTTVTAGTTDSTAAVIAAGAQRPGDAVTSLGSTLVVKILAPEPITAHEYGVYSHRFGRLWLIGGASNTGGAVLRQLFSDEQIRGFSAVLRPHEPTGLDYYPLPGKGERFPINDPDLSPRLTPRPSDDARFFQGILEGIARIEASAYGCLRGLGAPSARTVVTLGGGADNAGWMLIRQRVLGVPVRRAAIGEAAFGVALLALAGGVPG